MAAKQKTIEEQLANELIAKYKPENVGDMEDALKSVFGPMFEAMLKRRDDKSSRL